MSLVQLTNSTLFAVQFKECKLVGVDWTQAQWPEFHRDFELSFLDCLMNDASFFGLTLERLKLSRCAVHDVDFREANLSRSSMTECDFQSSLFQRTQLQKADLTDSCNYSIDVRQNSLAGAKFSRFEALALLESLGIELV